MAAAADVGPSELAEAGRRLELALASGSGRSGRTGAERDASQAYPN